MTQEQVGYHLIEMASNNVVSSWGGVWGQCPAVPNPIILPDGRHVHATQLNDEFDGYKLVVWMMDEPPAPVPEEISDRQFFQQLAIMTVITEDEALAAVMTGTIPAALLALIDVLPTEQQFGAKMLLSGATTFQRHHPMTLMVAGSMGWTDEQLDGLWMAAAAL